MLMKMYACTKNISDNKIEFHDNYTSLAINTEAEDIITDVEKDTIMV